MYQVETGNRTKTNVVKWMLGLSCIGVAIWANFYLSEQPILYRVLGVCFLFLLSAAILATTIQGKVFVDYLFAAKNELMKVVWPSRQETVQMTFMVIVITTGVAAFLWLVDTGLLDIMQNLILKAT